MHAMSNINYEMQLYCRTSQTAAFELYQNTVKRAILLAEDPRGKAAAKTWYEIIVECIDKWGRDPDFDKINYCIGKQTSAYNQLQRR
jgi:hypothetical protein